VHKQPTGQAAEQSGSWHAKLAPSQSKGKAAHARSPKMLFLGARSCLLHS